MAEYYDRSETGGGSFMMGLLAGAVIGAGIGLLLAPKPGAEMRNQLASRASDLAKRGRDLADRGREAGEELYGKARDVVSRTADEAERFANS